MRDVAVNLQVGKQLLSIDRIQDASPPVETLRYRRGAGIIDRRDISRTIPAIRVPLLACPAVRMSSHGKALLDKPAVAPLFRTPLARQKARKGKSVGG